METRGWKVVGCYRVEFSFEPDLQAWWRSACTVEAEVVVILGMGGAGYV